MQPPDRASSRRTRIASAAVRGDQPAAAPLVLRDQILHDAALGRDALAAQWLSAVQVSIQLSLRPLGRARRAGQLRREGKLLAVYIANPVPSYRYPTWQFSPDGQPVRNLAQMLRIMRSLGPFQRESNDLRRTTGWGEVEWFLSPHALLNGQSPSTVLATDPAGVLLAARTEFETHD